MLVDSSTFISLTVVIILICNLAFSRKARLITISCLLISLQGFAQDKKINKIPIIPVGWDAYLNWDQWPLQRIGNRAYMRSTHDRSGGNVDMSNYLYMKDGDYNFTLDVAGKGFLYFFRSNFWHGIPWHFIVDGKDNIVKETATENPINARKFFKTASFIPVEPFPEPLSLTWGITKGADLIWTPIPFETSFKLAYSRTSFGTGYYIYHQYANEENLSRPIRSWSIDSAANVGVTKLIEKAGTDIAPQNINKSKGKIILNKKTVSLFKLAAAPSVIRAFKIILPLENAMDLERLRLIVKWDGAAHASIDAPLCLLFGVGTLYNRDSAEYLVKGFPINIRFDYDAKKVELACYYPMPFFKSAEFELANVNPGDTEISYEIRYEPLASPVVDNSYFHATYKDIPKPVVRKDLILLDTKDIEGKSEWSGSFVGNSVIFSHSGGLHTLEGDPRFFFDDSESPQAYGTGTEEWGGGGFFWGGENMTLPFVGHPCGAPSKEAAKHEKDLIESYYRFLLADLMPFGRRALIQFEHGGENLSTEHYETITYWYGLPAPTLIKTDEIDIGNIASEESHSYASPEASVGTTISSRFELGIDTFPARPWVIPGRLDTLKPPGYKELIGKQVFPLHTQDGRTTQGISEFTVKLDKENLGVLLRRTLDYSFPNQKAEVYIQRVSSKSKKDEWKFAGVWYLAGSNTCVFSFPKGELDKREYTIRTSNRRFREDEFLIPARLTQKSSQIRIRIKFIPVDHELYPGKPFPNEAAWSELKYQIFSYTTPKFKEAEKNP
ncbi:MAG: DUF2961 domain-containing protein [Chryseolinea sp.]